ncbi:hypothetical protein [Yinghuangia sp. YIM S10712]|uniref:hypothetical protein n=1 Tax=Yinghuangia sp. YIM S10712 TaxID=3436930 RepID=UPI003F52E448
MTIPPLSTEPIDREAVVRRHTVELTQPDPAAVLTVGNGDFAYTAVITGMQTFATFHDQGAAMTEKRLVVNTATMATWGWHEMPNPDGFRLADAMSTYETARGPVEYPDRFDIAGAFGGDVADEFRAGTWLHVNPQRLDLGRIGLDLRPAIGAARETGPDALADTRQRLDLWTGTITSEFTYAGRQVRVTTVADPHHSRVAFRIESDLLAAGLARVAVRFPYASDGFCQTADWTAPGKHTTSLEARDERSCRLARSLDDTTYSLQLNWTQGRIGPADKSHTFLLTTSGNTLDIVATFHPRRWPLHPQLRLRRGLFRHRGVVARHLDVGCGRRLRGQQRSARRGAGAPGRALPVPDRGELLRHDAPAGDGSDHQLLAGQVPSGDALVARRALPRMGPPRAARTQHGLVPVHPRHRTRHRPPPAIRRRAVAQARRPRRP